MTPDQIVGWGLVALALTTPIDLYVALAARTAWNDHTADGLADTERRTA